MHTVQQTAAKFCMAIKLEERKILRGRLRPPPALAKNVCDTTDDAWSVCAS